MIMALPTRDTFLARMLVVSMTMLCTSASVASAESVKPPALVGDPKALAGQASARQAHDAAVADCERMWDQGTHMTRREWAQTCRRVQDRLQHLKVR